MQHLPVQGAVAYRTVYVEPVSNAWSTAGVICGVISFLCLPFVFGPLGLLFGAIGRSHGEPRASTALWVSFIGLVGGIVLIFIVVSMQPTTP